jgi:hypothetical protein
MEGSTMNEALLKQIRLLKRSVRRWRLVSLGLALLLAIIIAVGGITLLPTGESGDFWMMLPWVRARRQEELARQEAIMRADEAAKIAAEAAEQQRRARDEQRP